MSINVALRNGLAYLLCSLLAGCVAGPQPTPDPSADHGEVASLLAAARQSLGVRRADYLLEAAGLLLREDEPARASELLAEVAALEPQPPQAAHLAELQARLALTRGEPEAALQRLRQPSLMQAEGQLPATRQVGIGLVRARALAATGDHLASVQQRISLEPLLTARQRERNRSELWRSLMYLDGVELDAYRERAIGRQLRGWLELAAIAKRNQGNLDMQLDRLDQWMRHWPDHPGQALPGDLRLLRRLAADQPSQVALLLPLSGQLAPFAQALRDGFLAALFDSRTRGARTPSVRFYDTHGKDVATVYRRAVTDGAESVVGPLDKSQVAALYDEPLTTPVLALNRAADADRQPPASLFQFSLAPEDEALEVAERARQDGHRRVLIIAPESDAQSRELQTFTARWEAIGGSVAARAFFRDQQSLSAVIRAGFGLPQSEARAVALEQLLGRDLTFTPRRRDDIDAIFLLANPAQARSVLPTLAYHFAGDVPVYALSRSYAGVAQPQQDADLEGLRFTDMPWILRTSPLKQALLSQLPQSPNLLRFYAMGIDSYYLLPRLAQLAQLPESRVYGQTGTLRLDQRRIIRRELPLAIIKQGAPRELPGAMLRLDDLLTAKDGANEQPEDRPRLDR